MAIQIIDDPSRHAVSDAFGSALSTGIQNLVKHKLNAIQEQKRIKTNLDLLQGLGVPAEKAAKIAPVSEDILSILLKGGSASTTEGLASGESIKQQTLDLKKRNAQRVENKDVRDYLEPYNTQTQASKNNIRDYDTLIKLADKKDLRAGNTHALLDKLGLEGFNQNINTQLVSKLSARLSQNAGSAFGPGARITNFLESTFQKSIPSLWNTPQGIKTISEINKRSDQANILKNKARREIIVENGSIPLDIDDQVEERTKDKVDELEQEAMDIALRASESRTEKTFSKLPKAADYPNKRIQFPDGSIRKSNGKEWIKEKQ